MSDDTVDTRGLKCPMPALIARRALEAAVGGQEVTVLADDPMAEIDIPHLCQTAGHTLRQIDRQSDWTVYRLVAKAQ